MFDPSTGRVTVTQDVVWLNKMHYREDAEPTTEDDHYNDISLTHLMEIHAIKASLPPDATINDDDAIVSINNSHVDLDDDDSLDDAATLPELVPSVYEPDEINDSQHSANTPVMPCTDNEGLSTGTPSEDPTTDDHSYATPLPM